MSYWSLTSQTWSYWSWRHELLVFDVTNLVLLVLVSWVTGLWRYNPGSTGPSVMSYWSMTSQPWFYWSCCHELLVYDVTTLVLLVLVSRVTGLWRQCRIYCFENWAMAPGPFWIFRTVLGDENIVGHFGARSRYTLFWVQNETKILLSSFLKIKLALLLWKILETPLSNVTTLYSPTGPGVTSYSSLASRS